MCNIFRLKQLDNRTASWYPSPTRPLPDVLCLLEDTYVHAQLSETGYQAPGSTKSQAASFNGSGWNFAPEASHPLSSSLNQLRSLALMKQLGHLPLVSRDLHMTSRDAEKEGMK